MFIWPLFSVLEKENVGTHTTIITMGRMSITHKSKKYTRQQKILIVGHRA